MPDHVHLILSEPETKPLSTAIQVLKQTFSRTRPQSEVWESRYYDFNIYTQSKLTEKLSYIHLNPVRRALVTDPAHWPWSSFRHYTESHPTPSHHHKLRAATNPGAPPSRGLIAKGWGIARPARPPSP